MSSGTFSTSTNRPISVNPDEHPSLLGKDEMTRIAREVHGMTSGGGRTDISIVGAWRSDIRWGRNALGAAEDNREYHVVITRSIDGSTAFKRTNQLSPSALQETVRFLEASARAGRRQIVRPSISLPLDRLETPLTPVWSEHTVGIPFNERARIAGSLISQFTARDVMSSGFLEWRCRESMSFRFGGVGGQMPAVDEGSSSTESDDDKADDPVAADGPSDYVRHTQAQCSMTAFNPNGIGSSWTGLSSFDWNSIPYESLAVRAIDKCLAFTSPGVLEPGRYAAILEPQAVSALTNVIVKSLDRGAAERGASVFSFRPDQQLQMWRTRLGMKVVDERITIQHDPMDPALGVLPFPGLRPATWIEQGKLMSLSYNQAYARRAIGENTANYHRPAYRMEGGSTSIEEMIQSTQHGVIISRLSDLVRVNAAQMLMTGQTQDGIWEVRDGRIVRAVHNMRFTDSPLFVFNEVESIGPSVPVFSPSADQLMPIVVPSVKVNKFALSASLPLL